MKKILLVLLVLTTVSCSSTHYNGDFSEPEYVSSAYFPTYSAYTEYRNDISLNK